MGFYVSFELEIMLGARQVVVLLLDHYVRDGDLEDEHDTIEFRYKVFDPQEEAEITQLSAEDRETIYNAIMADLQTICE